jgi:very-short-patch-repair endonuclease
MVARRIHPEQREQLRYLRANMTRAEKDLWYRLNRNQLSVHFRRQHPIGPYIVDFAAVRPRLVVEIDGPTHIYPTREVLREKEIIDRGWRIVRFWNEEVFSDLDAMVEEIKLHLDT